MKTIEALANGDRKELGNLFGVGLIVGTKDTPDTIIEKCKEFKTRYEGYIANLNEVLENEDKLAPAIKKAKTQARVNNLSPEEQKALLAYLKEKYNE